MRWTIFKNKLFTKINYFIYADLFNFLCECVLNLIVLDCGLPSEDTGYKIVSNTGTILNAEATLSCDTDYIGSPADITCELSGWSQQTGCVFSELYT